MSTTSAHDPSTPSEKPRWLQKLEAESWQAELIISGVAIYGTFQLLELLEIVIDWLVMHVPESISTIAYYTVNYLAIAAIGLAIMFLLHFVLRALWIALVGLNSAYPQGIREEHPNMSRHLLEQVRRDHPSLTDYNDRLDRICSSLLAAAFGFSFSMASFGLSLAVVSVVAYLADEYLLMGSGRIIIIIYVSIIAVLILVNTVMGLASMRERPLVQRWHYRIVKLFSTVFFVTGNTRAPTYIQYTFYTNTSLQRYLGLIMGGTVVGTIILMIWILQSNFIWIRTDSYLRLGERTDRQYSAYYADQHPSGDLIFQSQLPSDMVTQQGQPLRVFVPINKVEEKRALDACSLAQPSGELEKEAARAARRRRYLDCLREYLRISVNEVPVPDYTLYRYEHPNRGEYGLMIYLPPFDYRAGENVLLIEHGQDGAYSVRRTEHIPFFYYPTAPVAAPSDTLLSIE